MGMKKKNPVFTDREEHLVEQLRERPELMERFEAILALTECDAGPVKKREEKKVFRGQGRIASPQLPGQRARARVRRQGGTCP